MRDQRLSDIFDGQVPPSTPEEQAMLDMKAALRQQYHATSATPRLTSDDLLRELRAKPAPAVPRFRWLAWGAPVAAAALAVWFFNNSNVQSPTLDPKLSDVPAVAMDTPEVNEPIESVATELNPEPAPAPTPEIEPEPTPTPSVASDPAPTRPTRTNTRRQPRPSSANTRSTSKPQEPSVINADTAVAMSDPISRAPGLGAAGNSFAGDSNSTAETMVAQPAASSTTPIVLVTDNPSRLAGVSVATELAQSDVVFGG